MGTKIYVGNLPYQCDDEQLRLLFEGEGRHVTEVAIITDRMTGQPRGFAFVQMANDEDAAKAIEALHGSIYGGRTLTVNEARAKDANERTSGGASGARLARPTDVETFRGGGRRGGREA